MIFSHYLRIEGVNLANFVLDTRQLSVIRGGGLKLLQAIEDIEKQVGDRAKPLSKGASIGLFGIYPETDVVLLQKDVQDILSSQGYEHGTFVVNVIPSGAEGFRQDLEGVLAANRWQQMQASSLSLPARNEDRCPVENGPSCAFDWLRPASLKYKGPNLDNGNSQYLSGHVHSRWKYGQNEKQNFYIRVTGIEKDDLPKFANEFEEIASGTGQLNGKMAVFYADGNKFGSWQQKLCQFPEDQQNWDEAIREKRESFLRDFLLDEVYPKKEWRNEKGEIRFETLLWGGDELMFVMPAELAWRFATQFFEYFKDWQVQVGQGTAQLTHTAAIVCCHHHTPIHRLTRLLKDQMAEFAKEAPGGRERDQLVFLAMESFDNLGVSFENGMKRRYGEGMNLKDLILHGDSNSPLNQRLAAFSSSLEILQRASSEFSRSQLRALATKLVQQMKETEKTPADLKMDDVFKDYFFRAKETGKDAVMAINAGFKSTTTALSVTGKDQPDLTAPVTLWIQLEELWDYALP